ncbi:MAG: MFS transporter [Planctomycetes bacterium]|nr:MFS transporter [Planctomycetota bacterium]
MDRVIVGPAPAMVKTRLSLMMFLQYAIWGAWLPLLWPFLSNVRDLEGDQIGQIFAVGAIGAIVAPFIAGQIADRYFNTEKFLGISHLLGGVLVWQLATIESFNGLLMFSLLYSLIYSPTLSLTNSLAFHHLPDRDADFGKVRVWGTIGWIAVGIAIGQWLLHMHTPTEIVVNDLVTNAAEIAEAQYIGMADAFRLSGILGGLMGLFCFLLPATPPAGGEQKNATFEALGEIKKQPLLTLFLLAVPVSCIHQFYFVHTAGFLGKFQGAASDSIQRIFGVGGGGLMTIGQMAEILVLAAIPLVAKQVSRKTLLGVGLAAYGLRMALFAYGNNALAAESAMTLTNVMNDGGGSLSTIAVLAGVALHGLCFGCFIFVAFMVVDEETTADVRASAQSLFNLVIIGLGIIVGSMIAGWVADWATVPVADGSLTETGTVATELDYTRLFSIPMWASLACLVALIAFYPNRPPRSLTTAENV